MANLSALVAAAGRGTRARLPYPKTLFKVQGTPILLRITELISQYDPKPTIIVSPAGRLPVANCLAGSGGDAWLVVQPKPAGMGDAVLRFVESPAYPDAEHVLLMWGDIPFIDSQTLEETLFEHLKHGNDFTFPTRAVDSAYTVVSRDHLGGVIGVVETREEGIAKPDSGERDIGLFIFRKDPVFAALREDLSGKYGRRSGEHGFLYVIEHLVRRGLKVEALPLAKEKELISLNALEDLAGIDPVPTVSWRDD